MTNYVRLATGVWDLAWILQPCSSNICARTTWGYCSLLHNKNHSFRVTQISCKIHNTDAKSTTEILADKLTRLAYLSELSDSSKLVSDGLMQHIISVLALPPSESYKRIELHCFSKVFLNFHEIIIITLFTGQYTHLKKNWNYHSPSRSQLLEWTIHTEQWWNTQTESSFSKPISSGTTKWKKESNYFNISFVLVSVMKNYTH